MAATAELRASTLSAHWLTATAVCLNLAITLPLAIILNVWQDDAYTLHSTAHGVAYAFRESITFEQNAPLYFVVITLWRDLNSTAIFARLFSVLCAAATVALLPGLVSRYLPRAEARWAVLTIAINPFLIWAALEIRVYALIVLISAILLLAFYDGFVDEAADRKAQALYGVCAAAGLYTQYYFAFLIAALGMYLLLVRRRWPAFTLWSLAAVAAFSPMIAILPAQVENFQGAFTPPHSPLDTARVLVGTLVRYVLPIEFVPHPTRAYILLMAIAVSGAAIAVRRKMTVREGDGVMPALLALAFAVFSIGLYVAHVHFLKRHGASLFVPAVFSAIAALTYLTPAAREIGMRAWYGIVALLSIIALGVTYAPGAKAGDWQRVAGYIESKEHPGEPIAVFQAENALPFEYYYRGPNRVVAVPHAVDFKRYDVTQFVVHNPADIARVLPAKAQRIWWIDAGDCAAANIAFGCDVVARYIAQHYYVVSEQSFYKADVRLLERLPFTGMTHFSRCPVFTKDDYYNRAVADAPIDRHSKRYIAAMLAAGNTGTFWAAARPVEYVNVASAATPMMSVQQKVPYHDFPVRYPWSPQFKIEPQSDAHAIVVSTATCRLYETYDTSFTVSKLSAYSGAAWDLRRPFVPMPDGKPSSMASGLSLFAGMVKWEEIRDGSVDHALNWAAPAGTVSQYGFVTPASDTDWLPYKGRSAYQLPYGAHLRLKRSFDTSTFGPQSKAIADALKTYGMYLADTGKADNALYTAMPIDGRNRWDARDLASLSRLRITDFDVLQLPRIRRVPGK